MVEVGNEAPDFCLPDKEGEKVCLKDFQEKWLVLYFYPRDNTTGCTREAVDFSQNLIDFQSAGATVLGVSPDSAQSHQKFTEKHDLKVTLLSDPDHQVIEAYGAWGTKKMYGKERQGVLRSTFIVDPRGRIAHIWRKVRVKGHAEKVKEELGQLMAGE